MPSYNIMEEIQSKIAEVVKQIVQVIHGRIFIKLYLAARELECRRDGEV